MKSPWKWSEGGTQLIDAAGRSVLLIRPSDATPQEFSAIAAAPELLAELAETATWLDERAAVLERHYGTSLEVTRLRGRAELIRFRLVTLGVA